MMDLNAPLGMTPPPRRRRLALLAVGLVSAILLGGVAWVLALADPQGGRPSIVAELPPAAAAKRAPLDTTPTGALPPQSGTAARPGDVARSDSLERGVMVHRGRDETPGATARVPLVIDVSRALDDPLGRSRGGAPADAKADAPRASPQPRVAIFVSGMGLDPGATRTAIDTMPAAVTLAFLPYGETLGATVAAAKAKGHEVLLQVPMQNDGASAPGPHTLRPDAPATTTKADIAWAMDRFAGYDGMVNLLGAPVTADAGAMTALLEAASARHLFYLDDGTSRRSLALGLAGGLHVSAIQADLVLDATGDPAAVRVNLDRLVAIAERKGQAIGMASGLPEHLGTIARFAAGLQAKGVILVPVAALVQGAPPDGMAATR